MRIKHKGLLKFYRVVIDNIDGLHNEYIHIVMKNNDLYKEIKEYKRKLAYIKKQFKQNKKCYKEQNSRK